MKYGLIGERLSHSFSKEIHEALGGYEYEIREIERDALDAFMRKRDFTAINVTIPYKEAVIPYLDFISDKARAIGAVNTIVNQGGKLYGYNTDFSGMTDLINKAKIEIKGQKTLILGTGGTSKTALAVLSAMGASEIHLVSRSGGEGVITYDEAYEKHSDAEVIVNTTPLGMYPSIDGLPIEPSRFQGLSGAVDAIYNPLRTRFIRASEEMGAAAEGGLYMLVAQGVRASEIFLGREYPEGTTERLYNKILRSKENIVLSGMPASGKTTVGKLLSERLCRPFIDLDAEIVKYAGRSIPEIFSEGGESLFRNIETEVVRKISPISGAVIATGGGAVLRDENVRLLSQNGRIYFLDRPLEMLMPTDDRPLASTAEAIVKRYNERYERYLSTADVRIENGGSAEEAAEKILGDFI